MEGVWKMGAIRCSLSARNTLSGVFAIFLLVLGSSAACAQKLWDAGGPNDNWFTAANWAGDTLPVSTDDVQNNTGLPILFNSNSATVNSFFTNGAFSMTNGTLIANVPGVSTMQLNSTFTSSGSTLTGFVVTATNGISGINSFGTTFNDVAFTGNLSFTGSSASLRARGSTSLNGNMTFNDGADLSLVILNGSTPVLNAEIPPPI